MERLGGIDSPADFTLPDKEKEVLDAVLDANERVDKQTRDLKVTGTLSWDIQVLKRDLKIEERLPHKTESETKKFYSNILFLRVKEMEQDGEDAARIAVVRGVAKSLAEPGDLRALDGEEDEERLAA